MDKSVWSEGDRVFWRPDISRSVGDSLPAVVRKVSDNDVTIDVLYRLGNQYVRENRRVTTEGLHGRIRFVDGIDTCS